MSDERRSSQRFRAYLPVRLHRAHTPHIVETLTKDISLGGIRCISEAIFPVATEVSLEIVLSTGSELLDLRGRTAWFRIVPHSEQFDVGIEFSDITPQNQRRLSAYLEHLSEQTAHIPS